MVFGVPSRICLRGGYYDCYECYVLMKLSQTAPLIVFTTSGAGTTVFPRLLVKIPLKKHGKQKETRYSQKTNIAQFALESS